MAMGKRKTERQQELWIAATDLPQAPGHPFYRRLNQLLGEHGFDLFVEGLCQKFCHDELGQLRLNEDPHSRYPDEYHREALASRSFRPVDSSFPRSA